MNLEAMLQELRNHGWTVAVHNDYRMHGQPFTFWLFTHEKLGIFRKGEGRSDEEAVRKVLCDIGPGRRCTHLSSGACVICTGMDFATASERERCARVVETFAKAYPTGIFIPPPDGEHGATVDACSARALREILPAVAEKVREGED